MIVISNSSPLIALSQINQLDLFQALFGQIYIPDTVYQEVVLQSNVPIQRKNIENALDKFIFIQKPKIAQIFSRKLDYGEQGVLNLALDKQADLLIIDDKKATKEAIQLGFKVIHTTMLILYAEKQNIISSHKTLLTELEKINIFLPRLSHFQ